MVFVVWVPLLLQVLVPVALLLWLTFGRPQSLVAWLVRVILVTCYVVAVSVAGMWLILPWYTGLIYGMALLLGMVHSRPARGLPFLPVERSGVAGLIVIGSVATFSLGLALYVLTGWRMPRDAVELSFPLRGGPYLVVNGGGNELINAHQGTLTGDRLKPWRGQSHGVDIVKLNRLAFRARGILPSDPAVYEIFGEPLYAPCAGEVVQATDGVKDLPPPQTDRQHMAGNHIILRCGMVWVLMGHMQNGSVRLRPGDRVVAGDLVGRVGNTGNTGEPHLHIHAQTPGTAASPLSGEPLAIRFGLRYPVRNARITGLSELPSDRRSAWAGP